MGARPDALFLLVSCRRANELLDRVAAADGPPALAKARAMRSAPGRLAIAAWTAVAESLGGEALVVQAHAGVGHLDPAGDVELVAAERDDAHRDAGRERLLGDALAAVGDDAGGPGDDRAVRQEPLDARVGRRVELAPGRARAVVATTATSSSASASSAVAMSFSSRW